MPSLAAVLEATQAALEAAIVGLTPTREASEKFYPRPLNDRVGTQPLEELTGAKRLFEVRLASGAPMREEWEGAATRGKSVSFEVAIKYPNTERWTVAAHDDADLISEHLLANHNPIAASVDGLELCTTDTEMAATLESNANDPQWLTMRIPLYVLVEVE
jgi:hypothetical protein